MSKSRDIIELVSSYRAYTTADALRSSAASEAPASTPTIGVASAGASWIASQFSVKTYNSGC